MPIARQVRMMRTAISPRFAISTFRSRLVAEDALPGERADTV
jgi:hypothetical protein